MTSPDQDPNQQPFAKQVHQARPDGSKLEGLSQNELDALRGKLIESLLQLIVQAFTGSFVPGGGSAFDQLIAYASQVPGLREFIEKITGKSGGDDTDLAGWVRDLLGGHQAFAKEPLNVQLSPNFPKGSIAPNGVWTIDTTGSRTPNDDSGCARVLANGTVKALRSGRDSQDVFKVSPGGTFTSSIYVRHEGYSGSGYSILLQVVPYSGGKPGAPVTIAAYMPTPGDVAWPGKLIAGTYPPINDPIFGGTNTNQPGIPEGIDGVQTRLVVTEAALSGVFRFDDAKSTSPVKVPMSSVGGLVEILRDIQAGAQAVVDTMLSALLKTPVVGGTLSQLLAVLGVIPPSSVEGAGGPATMEKSFFALIDAFLSGAVGAPGSTGGGLPDITTVMGLLGSNAQQGAYAWQLANMLNNTPVARGYLPTGRANYDITSANTFLPTTQSVALSSSFGLLQSMPIGVISWYGYGTSGITAFYINIRKVDPSTKERKLVHHSLNLVTLLQPGSSAADANWMFYELPSSLPGLATDEMYVEWVPVGGTHNIRGMSFADNIKDHPIAATPCVGTTVDYSASPNNPAPVLPKATSKPTVPWVEFAVSLGAVSDHREPQIIAFVADGDSVPIPAWCNRVDAITLGEGGDGHDGITFGIAGEPGSPGKFGSITWVKGTDYPSTGSTIVKFEVLANGTAKISIPGHSVQSEAGANGSGTKVGLKPKALGPGVFTYQGQKYIGGIDQEAAGGAGSVPGGGGNGGNSVFPQPGGKGGRAGGWLCFRQVEVSGDGAPPDTTPPTAPTSVTLDAATQSSLTISWAGATDA